MLLKCNFVLENKFLTSIGELLNPGLVLKSRYVFKLCLECFHWGFLFCYLRRNPLGDIENSVGSMFIPAWEKSLGVLIVRCSTGESKLN